MAKYRSVQKTVTVHDDGIDAIRRIETLVGLMGMLGQAAHAEPVEAVLVGELAGMIRGETRRVRQALDVMRKLTEA